MALISTLKGSTLKGRTLILAAPHVNDSGLTPAVLPIKTVAAAGNVTVALTGVGLTGSTGTLAPSIAVALTGNAFTGSQGSLAPSITLGLTGSAVAAAQGTLVALIEAPITLTGIEAVAVQGTLTPGITIQLVGVGLATSQGTLTPTFDLALTGSLITSATGTLVASTETSLNVALTGVGMAASQGSLSPSIEVGLTGDSVTAAQGILAPQVSVGLTGIAIAATGGSFAYGAYITPEYVDGGYVEYSGVNFLIGLIGNAITLEYGSLVAEQSVQPIVPEVTVPAGMTFTPIRVGQVYVTPKILKISYGKIVARGEIGSQAAIAHVLPAGKIPVRYGAAKTGAGATARTCGRVVWAAKGKAVGTAGGKAVASSARVGVKAGEITSTAGGWVRIQGVFLRTAGGPGQATGTRNLTDMEVLMLYRQVRRTRGVAKSGKV